MPVVQNDCRDAGSDRNGSVPDAHDDGLPAVAPMTVEELRASQPMLEHLPYPVMWIASDHRVLWINSAAGHHYDAEATHCYAMSHGHDEPCHCHGEPCPKQRAEVDQRAFSTGHIHTTSAGLELFKVTAMPVADGSVVEFHVPLDDVLGRDKLTGCHTRTVFEQLLHREVALLRRIRERYCILMVDFDHFKQLNDEHGHLAGDRALADLGRAMLGSVRESDSVGRWGGDEFCIFLPATDTAGGLVQAKRVHDAIGQRRTHGERPLTVSIGVASALASTEFTAVIAAADRAMYEAKRAGRGRTVAAD